MALTADMALLMAVCWPVLLGEREDRSGGLELVVLHTNDAHSFFAGMDNYGDASRDGRNGLGRVTADMKDVRKDRDKVIAVDSGDWFQGGAVLQREQVAYERECGPGGCCGMFCGIQNTLTVESAGIF